MVKVKICGLKREEDILAANQAKPDYIGFIFAKKSKRYVDPDQAAQLKQTLAPDIQAVGVFVNEPIEEVVRICQQGTIDLVQLHGDEDQAYVDSLKDQVGQKIIQAISVADKLQIKASNADYLLFDSVSASRGGSGKVFDWQVISDYTDKPFFLAGGLGVENIEEALKVVQPFAVDASSSLETDGYKDPEKMQAFVEKIREVTYD